MPRQSLEQIRADLSTLPVGEAFIPLRGLVFDLCEHVIELSLAAGAESAFKTTTEATEDRFVVSDSEGSNLLVLRKGDRPGGLVVKGVELPREDVEELQKAIANYLRTGFFDGRVRT